jgi:diacylglycerol kinase family enzyme
VSVGLSRAMTNLLEERPNEGLVDFHEMDLKPSHAIAFTCKSDAPALAILVNTSAGAFRFFGIERLRGALRVAGLDSDVPLIRCSGHELHEKALALVREGVRAVGVFGGDGSARTVALALRGLDVPTLPLPGGTLNRLCHRVHGHASLNKTLRGLGQAKPLWLSGGLANEQIFLVASGFGPWMAFQDVRETARSQGMMKGLRALKSLGHDLFAAKLTTPNTARKFDVVIAAPGYIDDAFGLGSGLPNFPDRGLEVVEARLRSVTSSIWLAIAVIARRWRRLFFVHSQIESEHVLEFDGEEIVGLVDGERRRFGRQVILKSIPRAALVLSTRSS